jgi:hypothetical protein
MSTYVAIINPERAVGGHGQAPIVPLIFGPYAAIGGYRWRDLNIFLMASFLGEHRRYKPWSI